MEEVTRKGCWERHYIEHKMGKLASLAADPQHLLSLARRMESAAVQLHWALPDQSPPSKKRGQS